MTNKDLKKYSGYIPIRWEHQKIFTFIDTLIPHYTNNIFKANWTGIYSIKIYRGEKNHIRIREKERGVYRYIPLSVWLDLSCLEKGKLSIETWEWVRSETMKYIGKGSVVRVLNHDVLSV